MPRKLTATITLDDLEDEILFSRACIKADVNASDLLSMTDSWLGSIDEVRAADRQVRERAADVDASRALANDALDVECIAFGDDLYRAVGKDRESRRWMQFFSMSVSKFTGLALTRQVEMVQGWLGLAAGADDVLDAHRSGLETHVNCADQALRDTRNLTQLRGTVWQKRESLTAQLTSERDHLREVLGQRARERCLSRAWPDLFFKTGEK